MVMSFQGRSIGRIGVVGSGNIGPDIALHFALSTAGRGVEVVVVDIAESALEAGRARVDRKVDKLAAKGKLKTEKAAAIKDALRFTTDYDQLAGAALVVEAASETLDVKRAIYRQVEARIPPEAVLASNTSHLEPERIFAEVDRPQRALVAHYFFPAERNPVVELVGNEATSEESLRFLEALYEETGKIPIRVGSRYGFAVNPVFEGMFLASALLVEAGVARPEQVDAVACQALGYGIGPFTAMNLTGGNPLTRAALPEYGQRVMPWFRSPRILEDAVASGSSWPVAERGASVDVPTEVENRIRGDLMGAYFGLVTEGVDSGVVDLGSQELAVSEAMAVRPPFTLINEVGVREAHALVEDYARRHEGFRVPELLRRQAASGQDFEIPVVHRRDHGDVAVITIRRPSALNALSADVFDQLEAHLRSVGDAHELVGAVVTGFGPRAFVAGADIKELSRIESAEGLASKSRRGQEVFWLAEHLGKPVVAAMNGLAFGGGLELAMSCTARLARQGQAVFAAQPEPKLGVIPGYGGTQRLPRLVGLQEAWVLLRLGEPISSARALEIGLVDRELPADVLREEAVAACRALARGEPPGFLLREKPEGPIPVPEELPELDIGHLSRKIDALVQEAILEGARRELKDGLALEAELFGSCRDTEDYGIGIRTFLEKGARAKAPFVHR